MEEKDDEDPIEDGDANEDEGELSFLTLYSFDSSLYFTHFSAEILPPN